MYRLGERDQSDTQGGSIEGGATPWGEIGNVVKNLGVTPHYALWGTGWVNLQMMMADTPYWKPTKEDSTAKMIESKSEIRDFLM